MTEILETDNAFYRGAKFEEMFAEFMKRDLRWSGYVIRSQQKARLNNRGSNVDIIANRPDSRIERFNSAALIVLMLGIVAFGLNLLEIQIPNVSTDTIGSLGFIFLIGGSGYILLGKLFSKEYAWVECKNTKGKTTYEQVSKCVHEFEDYQSLENKEYRFVAKYFASAAGFVENALKLALDKGFECYTYKDGKYEKVNYWK
jgi:hypothetical protein